MDKELSTKLHNEVKKLCKAGDKLLESRQYKEGRKQYVSAFDLLPEPKENWEAATWILAAIGDCLFLEKDFNRARDAFADAVQYPGGLGNVFIHLRLGQCHFELGDVRRAGDNLARAYMGGGREAFEKEDPKYFSHLTTILKPPLGETEL